MLHSSQYFSTLGLMTAPGSHTSQAWEDRFINKNIFTRKYLNIYVCLMYIPSLVQKRQLESKVNRVSQ
jgi:hypothetical protein